MRTGYGSRGNLCHSSIGRRSLGKVQGTGRLGCTWQCKETNTMQCPTCLRIKTVCTLSNLRLQLEAGLQQDGPRCHLGPVDPAEQGRVGGVELDTTVLAAQRVVAWAVGKVMISKHAGTNVTAERTAGCSVCDQKDHVAVPAGARVLSCPSPSRAERCYFAVRTSRAAPGPPPPVLAHTQPLPPAWSAPPLQPSACTTLRTASMR